MTDQPQTPAPPTIGRSGLALWYASALLIGLFPVLNTLFGLIALVFTLAGLIVLGALLLRKRLVTIAVGHLLVGLLLAGTAWWFVTALLLDFD